jgi:hypothetical protein
MFILTQQIFIGKFYPLPISDKDIEKQLRTIALNTVAMLKNRIQNDGEKTDGSVSDQDSCGS